MNDRIREFIKEATYVSEADDPDYRHESFDRKRFARMIVRECAELVYDNLDATAPKLAEHLEALILKHFGVDK